MNGDIRPNFFIVGAAKCGTTSLYRYLEQHPDLYMSSTKEPHYFGTDLDVKPNRRVRDEQRYFELFRDARGEQARGEASSKYLYSQQAAAEIRAFAPDAKIIIMLRNPLDMMWSMHGQNLYNAEEDIIDFEEALQAQDDRRRGRRIPPGSHGPNELQYTAMATFSPQVQRFLDVFDRDRIKFIFFEDFAADTRAVVKDVFRFLGVDDTFEPTIDVHNKGNWLRNPAVKRFMKDHPRLSRAISSVLPRKVRRRMGDALVAVRGGVPERPANMDPQLRRKLCEQFRDDVQQLSRLVNRDLSHWVTPPAAD